MDHSPSLSHTHTLSVSVTVCVVWCGVELHALFCGTKTDFAYKILGRVYNFLIMHKAETLVNTPQKKSFLFSYWLIWMRFRVFHIFDDCIHLTLFVFEEKEVKLFRLFCFWMNRVEWFLHSVPSQTFAFFKTFSKVCSFSCHPYPPHTITHSIKFESFDFFYICFFFTYFWNIWKCYHFIYVI